MPVTDHPAWPSCKIAIARLAQAGAKLEEAQMGDPSQLPQAEQEFREAVRTYDALRAQIAGNPDLGWCSNEGASRITFLDGQPTRIAAGEASRRDVLSGPLQA